MQSNRPLLAVFALDPRREEPERSETAKNRRPTAEAAFRLEAPTFIGSSSCLFQDSSTTRLSYKRSERRSQIFRRTISHFLGLCSPMMIRASWATSPPRMGDCAATPEREAPSPLCPFRFVSNIFPNGEICAFWLQYGSLCVITVQALKPLNRST